MRKLVGVALVGVLTLAACGGGGSETTQEGGTEEEHAAACSPSGTELSVVAKDVAFDAKCLAAPAGQAFKITLDNQDPQLPHNVSIYTKKGGDDLFMGETFPGPDKKTYDVEALEEGHYYFQCDVHPNMSGEFVVE